VRTVIETRIEKSATPDPLQPAAVAREFKRLLAEGARLLPAGDARRDPMALLSDGYTPKYRVRLFDTTFYLTNARQNPDLRFFVAYVVQQNARTGRTEIFPRIFYKDISLIWRAASHIFISGDELWIGKGDTTDAFENGEHVVHSVESTTDLPLELQTAFETLVRQGGAIRYDLDILPRILRRAPRDRVEPYADFTAPRRRAAADRRNLIHGGRPICRFGRRDDPTSLKIARGFEPDFDHGVLEVASSRSTLYGGKVRRFRVLSKNRSIQYLFMAAPRHAFVIPPQALTTELSSFGVRTVDVVVHEELCVPGYEYHFLDESVDPPVMHSQIPEGFAGEPSPLDGDRVDASAWIEELPVVREFRKKCL